MCALLFECDEAVEDEVGYGVDDVADECCDAVSGDGDAVDVEEEVAEFGAVDEPDGCELEEVAYEEAGEETRCFAGVRALRFEYESAVAEEGVDHAADVSAGVADVVVDAEE